MSTVAMAMPVALVLPSMARPQALSYSLDLSCPLALPPRASSGVPWPYPVAWVSLNFRAHNSGPSIRPTPDAASYLRRRYLETLFLSDVLFPLPAFAQDLAGLASDSDTTTSAGYIPPLLLSLPEVEKRHRKTLLPIVTAFSSSSSNRSSEIAASIVEEALKVSSLAQDEKDVLVTAMTVRLSSRAMDEGGVIKPKQLCDELEKRETLIQIIMLFQYLSYGPLDPPKKRKREKRKSTGPSVVEDPATALELLVDRLSVWSAVAELGLGQEDGREENKMQLLLSGFWDDVVKPYILPKQPDICASFHLKVFARPLSPTIQAQKAVPPVPTAKKSRKPLMTRARPSSDMLTQPDHIPLYPPAPPATNRTLSRAASDMISRRSPSNESRDRSLSRSLSGRPTDLLETRRSRSTSIDPGGSTGTATDLGQFGVRKTMTRAPSGKDMFKGRQVGFMKRSSSVLLKKGKEKESQVSALGRTESQSRVGLLGRKTSDPKARRNSEDSQSQQAGTLIFATPSKPRGANAIFGSRIGQFAMQTPIQEGPSSAERPSYIMDTPQTSGRMSKDVQPYSIAEPPVAPRRIFPTSPGSSYAGMAINALNSEAVEDSGDDDSLADLMVMTDDEDEAVPDTPARR